MMPESREYPSRPFVGVGVVVLKEENVLLIRRGRPPRLGEWSLPGGAQSVGETVEATARREVLEETGVSIQNPEFLEVVDSIIKDDDGRVKFHYTLIDYWANWESGTPQGADDAQHAEWISFDQLEELGLWSKTIEVIQKARKLRDIGSRC
jgi:8-oxo-dGTP diphosphatase